MEKDRSVVSIFGNQFRFLLMEAPGRANKKPGSGNDNSKSSNKLLIALNFGRVVWDKRHICWECCRCAWKSELLLIVRWYLNPMYSVCTLVDVSRYLYSYLSTHIISWLAAGGAWTQSEVHLKMTIEWTQRCSWRPLSCELRDILEGHYPVNWEIHLESMIKQVWKCTGRS